MSVGHHGLRITSNAPRRVASIYRSHSPFLVSTTIGGGTLDGVFQFQEVLELLSAAADRKK